MPTATKKDYLQPTARVLEAAIAAHDLTLPQIATRIGMSPATLHLWQRGYHGVSPDNAKALGKVLNIDPASIVSGVDGGPGRKGGKRQEAGRPMRALNKKTNGPAARAVALLEATQAPQDTRGATGTLSAQYAAQHASQPRHGANGHAAPGVFRMEARADGTVAIWVQTVYPMEKGADFVKWLLDFGVLPAPPEP